MAVSWRRKWAAELGGGESWEEGEELPWSRPSWLFEESRLARAEGASVRVEGSEAIGSRAQSAQGIGGLGMSLVLTHV